MAYGGYSLHQAWLAAKCTEIDRLGYHPRHLYRPDLCLVCQFACRVAVLSIQAAPVQLCHGHGCKLIYHRLGVCTDFCFATGVW